MLYFFNYIYNNLIKQGEIIFWISLFFVLAIIIALILKVLKYLYRKLFGQIKIIHWALILIVIAPLFFYNLFFS